MTASPTQNSDNRLRPPKEVAVPAQIKTAASLGKLAFFVGNGISRLYGMPSWEDLCNRMLMVLANNGVIDHNKVELLSRQSLKARISIADHYFRAHRESKPDEFCYRKLLYNEEVEANRSKMSAYDSLAKCGAKFITTNYDTLLFDALEGNSKAAVTVKNLNIKLEEANDSRVDKELAKTVQIFGDPFEFNKNQTLNNNVVFHIHGSTNDEKTIVASTFNYLKLYSNPNIQSFLQWFFEKHVVVFLGYGLEELELLDLIIRSGTDKQSPNKSNSFYLLLPLLSHEMEILEQLEIYYGQLGIEVIPFSRNQRGYAAYADLLEIWSGALAKEIQAPTRVDSLELMDNLINEFEGMNR